MAISDRYLAANTVISRRVQNQLASLWRDIDWSDLDGWMRQNVNLMIAAVRRGQLDASALALPYLEGAALEAGVLLPPSASIATGAMVTSNATDRDVAKLLQGSVILTKFRIGQGYSQEEALKSGGQRLFGVADLLVRDAGREALTVNMILNDAVVGYRRQASGNSCGRCLILVGKFFKNNEGFRRHPQCDCVHVPVYKDRDGNDVFAGDTRTGQDIFDEMTPEQQFAALGRDAKLVQDGMPLQDVVNKRLRAPEKLDRIHRANSTKVLRQKYGDDPAKLARELGRRGLLA